MNEAWNHLSRKEQTKWKETTPTAFSGDDIDIPLIFEKDRISAEVEGKQKITTGTLTVSTPTKYSSLLRTLLDNIVLGRNITNLIPFALGRENAQGYYNIIASQARFMEQHRNIQVLQVPAELAYHLSDKGQTLAQALNNNPAIKRITYDRARERYYISTSVNTNSRTHHRSLSLREEAVPDRIQSTLPSSQK